MRTKGEKISRGHGRLVVTLVLAIAIVALASVYSRFGGFGTGPSADADEFARYAAPVSGITVPEGTRIVALGEATHGNREFQELKLDVFQVMVERYGVRAFALEADFGGCQVVNRYIHGGEGTVEGATEALVFTIYQTDEMSELISWMRTYNETAAPGEDLCFYGFDMQDYSYSHQLLLEEAQRLGLDTSALESLWDGDDYADGVDTDQRAAVYADIRQGLEALGREADTALALQLVAVLEQSIELGRLASSSDGVVLRDQLMAQNVLWILGREEERGNQAVFVSAHNGHIEQEGFYGPDSPVMGNLLASSLGEDAYFAIGTDFFVAEVNLPKGDGRMTHTFYSYDPLAKAAERCGYETCWLDFSLVPKDSELAAYIDSPIMMGSIGEGFNPLMLVLPQAYRVKREPARPYDGMIFVPHAHPTQTRSR